MTKTMQEVVETIYRQARADGIVKSSIVMVVDFTKPSSQKRLQVIEMNEGKVLLDTWCAHGTNTGGLYAKYFSNKIGSHQSSLGTYKTNGTYISKKFKRALIIDGLEKGFNDKARVRAIVVHGSNYIGNGKTGRSWGCFAVPYDVKDKLIDLIKNGHLIIAYYPNSAWLQTSKFINT